MSSDWTFVSEDVGCEPVRFEAVPDADRFMCLTCGWMSGSLCGLPFDPETVGEALDVHACEHLNREPVSYAKRGNL